MHEGGQRGAFFIFRRVGGLFLGCSSMGEWGEGKVWNDGHSLLKLSFGCFGEKK